MAERALAGYPDKTFADALVTGRWRQIKALAEALLDRGQLDQVDIAAVLRDGLATIHGQDRDRRKARYRGEDRQYLT